MPTSRSLPAIGTISRPTVLLSELATIRSLVGAVKLHGLAMLSGGWGGLDYRLDGLHPLPELVTWHLVKPF